MTDREVYVSITGLRIKSIFHYPQFFWLATASMTQAQGSEGLIRADARMIDGVHHTLSIWKDEQSMRAFLLTGAHKQALQAFRRIATGKTLGYLTTTPPDWSEVNEIWLRDGRDV